MPMKRTTMLKSARGSSAHAPRLTPEPHPNRLSSTTVSPIVRTETKVFSTELRKHAFGDAGLIGLQARHARPSNGNGLSMAVIDRGSYGRCHASPVLSEPQQLLCCWSRWAVPNL
jgi:hypothetical protein